MKLSQLFSYLTYGELANLKVGGKDWGGIYPKYSDEVVSYITQGLTALHTRFALKHEEVIIQQFDHITDYYLRTQYAQQSTESTETYKYIMDSAAKPFTGDVLRIEELYDEEGEEVPLNDEVHDCSMFTPKYDLIQMVQPDSANAYSVIYKADHTPIDLKANLPTAVEVEVPDSIIRPLVLYVSSLAHTAVGSPEGMNTGFAKMQEYEALCIQMELQGAIHKEKFTNDRIRREGWV